MTEIHAGTDGRIQLPPEALSNGGLQPGERLVCERDERGLRLHYARPDARKLYLEVTTACNLSCAMCIRHAWQDPVQSMSAGTFERVLDGLRAFPDLRRVVIAGYGEPLVHPRLADMAAQLRDLGAGVTLVTNGLLLDRARAQALLDAGIDTLVVSLDSLHVQAYEQAGVDGGLDRVLENLHGLSGLIRRGGFKKPALGLEFVAARSNLPELERLPDLARQVGASFVIVNNLLPHTPEMAGEILYDRDEPLRLGGGWGLHRGGWIAWGHPKLPRMKWGAGRKCPFVNDLSLTIGWDGEVSPCTALMHTYRYYLYGRVKDVARYTLGSVHEQPLVDVWTSDEYVTFRGRVHDFRFPSCVECGMDCTYAQENIDCFGNEPSCADCLWAQRILNCP